MSFRLSEHAFSRGDWQLGRLRNAGRHARRAGDAISFCFQAHLRPTLHLSTLAATLLLSTPLSAKDYVTREVGPWTISRSSDGEGCFLTRTYQGPRKTTLLFGLDVDDSNRLTILNPNWSIREKEQLRLGFRLSNASFPRHLAVGIAANGEKGFVTSFGAVFPGTFAASQYLHIARGNVPVEELNLDGSGVAVAELRKCVNLYRGTPAAARSEREDASRIPNDPFAIDAGRKSKK